MCRNNMERLQIVNTRILAKGITIEKCMLGENLAIGALEAREPLYFDHDERTKRNAANRRAGIKKKV